MFAIGDKVVRNPGLATFAAFGSFAMLLFVDFGGPMRDRLRAQAALALVGAALVCLGTVASRSVWVATAAMVIVAFGVLFAGVASSVLAGATTSMLLAFILSVSLSAPVAAIPARLEGWGMTSAAALLAVTLLWPAPERAPLREAASTGCRALAARLRAEVALVLGADREVSSAGHEAAVACADAAARALQQQFFATPYRPTGLGTSTRMVVRLVDELSWLNTVIVAGALNPNRRRSGLVPARSNGRQRRCWNPALTP